MYDLKRLKNKIQQQTKYQPNQIRSHSVTKFTLTGEHNFPFFICLPSESLYQLTKLLIKIVHLGDFSIFSPCFIMTSG